MVCDRASTYCQAFSVLNLQKSCLRFILKLPSVNVGKFETLFLFKIDGQSISLAGQTQQKDKLPAQIIVVNE